MSDFTVIECRLRLEMIVVQGTHRALCIIETGCDDADCFELVELLRRRRFLVLSSDGVGVGCLVPWRVRHPLDPTIHVGRVLHCALAFRLRDLLRQEKSLLGHDGLVLWQGDLLA